MKAAVDAAIGAVTACIVVAGAAVLVMASVTALAAAGAGKVVAVAMAVVADLAGGCLTAASFALCCLS